MMETISDSPSPRRWRRYPKYQLSGVEWITELPDHWKREKISRVGFLKGRIGWRGYTSNDIRDANEGFLTIGATQITKIGTIDLSKATFISKEKYEESPEIKLFGNEILIVKVGATIGKIGFFPEGLGDATINPNVMIFSSVKYFNRFIFYSFKGEYLQILLELNKSAGAQDAINQEFFNNLWLFLPPLPEQHTIAAFLDRETPRIDALIAKKERQIELLQEKRTALISHAVTKGLDPNAKMKDSGIEWLGMIPEHWEVLYLGRLSQLVVPMRDKPPEFDGDIPWIRIEDFDGKYISDSKTSQRVSLETVKKMNLKIFPVGTVLCSCSCRMGSTAIVVNPLISNQTFIGIIPKNDLNSTFLYYLMSASSQELQAIGKGAIQQYLSREEFSHLKIASPPLPEQHAIAAFLDRETARIDGIIEKINGSIEKLNEYRSALISAAVTGKIDVRQEIHA